MVRQPLPASRLPPPSHSLLSFPVMLLRQHLLLLQEYLRESTLGDLVDSLTRSGSFAFLSDLFDTERLFELRDFRIARVMPKGEAVEQFAASMHLVLDLADKYPRNSLAAHILDCVAQFLPALLCPCTRRGRVRQIISNTKRFQRGEWKGEGGRERDFCFLGNFGKSPTCRNFCVLRGEKLTPMLSVSKIALNVKRHLSRLE
jgi:hypothetical protein